METKSVQHEAELAECAVLLAISKLNVPGFVSVAVVTSDREAIKVAKVLLVEEEILGVAEVAVEEDVVVEGHKKQTLLLTEITVKNLPDRFSIVPSAFSVEQLTGHERQSSDLITLVVGGVDVFDVLIDSGATCNVMGQQTWDMLKMKGIKHGSCKSARELFAYGDTEPLPTLGTFTADVMLTGNHSGCRVDFVVVKGDGRMLLGHETT